MTSPNTSWKLGRWFISLCHLVGYSLCWRFKNYCFISFHIWRFELDGKRRSKKLKYQNSTTKKLSAPYFMHWYYIEYSSRGLLTYNLPGLLESDRKIDYEHKKVVFEWHLLCCRKITQMPCVLNVHSIINEFRI